MWIRFLRDRRWRPAVKPPVTMLYRGGRAYSVKQVWAKALIAAGDAEKMATPPRRRSATNKRGAAA